jgi:hypothetical protein
VSLELHVVRGRDQNENLSTSTKMMLKKQNPSSISPYKEKEQRKKN